MRGILKPTGLLSRRPGLPHSILGLSYENVSFWSSRTKCIGLKTSREGNTSCLGFLIGHPLESQPWVVIKKPKPHPLCLEEAFLCSQPKFSHLPAPTPKYPVIINPWQFKVKDGGVWGRESLFRWTEEKWQFGFRGLHDKTARYISCLQNLWVVFWATTNLYYFSFQDVPGDC